MIYDIDRAPVDGTAARVLRRGFQYESARREQEANSPTPIPTKAVPAAAQNLTGRRFGRMVVVGYYGPSPNRRIGSQWVVRCVCGTYSVRRTKSVLNPKNLDMCEQCRHVEYLRKRAVR